MTHFIVNPQSRSGKGLLVWEDVKRHLDAKKIPYELHLTDCPGDAIYLAKKITQHAAKEGKPVNVVGLGGDGTLCEVINGAELSDNVRIGYLPTGSGNDFARSMHYPSNLRTAVERITDDPETQPIDFGVLKLGSVKNAQSRFIVSCGIGYDAAVCVNLLTTKWKKRLNTIGLGKLSYIFIGIKQLLQLKPVDGYLIIDGKRLDLKKISFVSCHVQPFEGGGFRFAPDADCRDGKLELCVMAGGSRLELIPALLTALFGKLHDSLHVHHYSCKTAAIHLDKPRSVHTDGEVHPPQTDIMVSDSGQKIHLIKV